MKLAPAQLAKHLQGGLAPVYIVSGDDPLLCQEAADAIRTAARQQGFDERQVFSADASFDWGTLLQAGASMSLFAEKRLLELRLPSGKPGDKGAAALMEYCSRPAEDTILLISLPKLDGSAQKTKWGKALVEGPQTQFIQIWPVDSSQLPQWIRQRLSQSGLSASTGCRRADRRPGRGQPACRRPGDRKAQADGRRRADHRRNRTRRRGR